MLPRHVCEPQIESQAVPAVLHVPRVWSLLTKKEGRVMGTSCALTRAWRTSFLPSVDITPAQMPMAGSSTPPADKVRSTGLITSLQEASELRGWGRCCMKGCRLRRRHSKKQRRRASGIHVFAVRVLHPAEHSTQPHVHLVTANDHRDTLAYSTVASGEATAARHLEGK